MIILNIEVAGELDSMIVQFPFCLSNGALNHWCKDSFELTAALLFFKVSGFIGDFEVINTKYIPMDTSNLQIQFTYTIHHWR